jgi:hypothetical protein
MFQLKRQHSAEPLTAAARKSPSIGTPALSTTPPEVESSSTTPALNITNTMFGKDLTDDAVIGSPLKRQRAMDGEGVPKIPAPIGDILALAEASQAASGAGIPTSAVSALSTEMEEEL